MIPCYFGSPSQWTDHFFCWRHDFTCCIQRWTLGCLRWKWCDQRCLSAEGPGILLYDVLVMLYDVKNGCGLKTIWSICIFKYTHIIHMYIYIYIKQNLWKLVWAPKIGGCFKHDVPFQWGWCSDSMVLIRTQKKYRVCLVWRSDFVGGLQLCKHTIPHEAIGLI